MTFTELQAEVAKWSLANFGHAPAWHPLLGIGEEVGELNHAFLKAAQGIRGTAEEHRQAAADAVGDIAIYLADFCHRYGLDMSECVAVAWNTVKNRDWSKRPMTG